MVQRSYSAPISSIKTLANARNVDPLRTDKKEFKNYISENLNLHTESYRTSSIQKITFTYRVFDGNVKLDILRESTTKKKV